MDEIFQKLNLANNLWQTQKCRQQKFFEATDIWLRPATGEIEVESKTVQESNLKTWLADEVGGSDGNARFVLQRFVWAEIDVKGREIMLDSSIGKTLIKTFKLGLANGYLTSATSGITAFPPSPSENGEISTFAFGHAPKMAATWSQEHFTSWLGRPATTRSMVFMAKESIEAAQDFLKKSWTASLYHSNMFPAFILAIQMGMEIGDSQRKDIEKVHRIERSTGFHTFTHRAEGDIISDSGHLVVFTSGLAAKLASMERNSKVLRMLLEFVANTIDQKHTAEKTVENQEEDDKWLRAKKESRELLSHHISVLRDRLGMLDLETDYLTKRVKMQTESLFHIIASEDNITGFKMAKSSESIAWSSYQTARSTYRDSSSMKTLAIVTMFFLPGNFISAMFSMPMFEWTEVNPASSYIGVGLLPQFSLYWAITIPLTLVTFMLYFGWLWRLKRDLADSTPQENPTSLEYEEEHNSEEAFARRLDRKRREHTNDMATPPKRASHDLSRFESKKLFNKSEA